MYSHRVVATILQAKDFANLAAKMGMRYNGGDYWFQVIGFIVSLAAPTSLLFYEIH